MLRASLDGLTEDGQPVELKCPSQKVWDEVVAKGTHSEASRLYYYQVQHQILVTGANKGWLVFYRDGELNEFKVGRDEIIIHEIVSKAREFWTDLKAGKAPEKDPERDFYVPNGKQSQQWILAAEEYRECETGIQDLKQQLKALEVRQKPQLEALKSLMGDFCQADYAGVKVTKYATAGRINYKQLLAEKMPELTEEEMAQYRDKPSERCRVTVSEEVKPRHIVDEEVLAPLKNMPEEVENLYF